MPLPDKIPTVPLEAAPHPEATLPGPSRTITVEPIQVPREDPGPAELPGEDPQPEEAPGKREKEPDEVPA